MMHYSPVVLFFTSCTHSWVIHSYVIPLWSWFSGFLSLFSRGIYASVYVCAVGVQLPFPFRCSLPIMVIKHRYNGALAVLLYHWTVYRISTLAPASILVDVISCRRSLINFVLFLLHLFNQTIVGLWQPACMFFTLKCSLNLVLAVLDSHLIVELILALYTYFSFDSSIWISFLWLCSPIM